jgi:hypothetical protein
MKRKLFRRRVYLNETNRNKLFGRYFVYTREDGVKIIQISGFDTKKFLLKTCL